MIIPEYLYVAFKDKLLPVLHIHPKLYREWILTNLLYMLNIALIPKPVKESSNDYYINKYIGLI